MKLLAISGSLRAAANTRVVLAAVAAAIRQAQEREAAVELVTYDEVASLPAFNEEIESPTPEPVQRLREAIGEADGLLIVTPEYNASIPGALKNAIDWASRPAGESVLGALPAAIISNSDSPFGGIWAGEHLRRALTFAGAEVIDAELAIGKVKSKFSGDQLTDPDTLDEIAALTAELISAASAKLDHQSDLTGASTS